MKSRCSVYSVIVAFQLLPYYGHSCRSENNNLSPLIQTDLCVCVGPGRGHSARLLCHTGSSLQRWEWAVLLGLSAGSLCSIGEKKYRDDVGRWAVRKAARWEPHFRRFTVPALIKTDFITWSCLPPSLPPFSASRDLDRMLLCQINTPLCKTVTPAVAWFRQNMHSCAAGWWLIPLIGIRHTCSLGNNTMCKVTVV